MIKLSIRQLEIISLVKENGPITSESIASKLGLTRAALRADLSALTMCNILEARPNVGYIYAEKKNNNILYNLITDIKVKEIMSKATVVNEQATVYEGIIQLFMDDVGTLFVENDGVLVGAVSRKDFLKIAIGGLDIHKVPIAMVMTRMPKLIMVDNEDNVLLAAQRIMENEIDSIPVVESIGKGFKEEYKIVGKVSKTNITKLFVSLGTDS